MDRFRLLRWGLRAAAALVCWLTFVQALDIVEWLRQPDFHWTVAMPWEPDAPAPMDCPGVCGSVSALQLLGFALWGVGALAGAFGLLARRRRPLVVASLLVALGQVAQGVDSLLVSARAGFDPATREQAILLVLLAAPLFLAGRTFRERPVLFRPAWFIEAPRGLVARIRRVLDVLAE